MLEICGVVGDWNISILYDGQHIQGSPFNVRVFDASQVKVYGLEGGSVENAISFSGQYSGITAFSRGCTNS